ncbi:MAG: hypothetical protein IAE65_06665 [Ignavibacteria bacterium]|nr:hypothetical protein [Ignavibacteria bacterium]
MQDNFSKRDINEDKYDTELITKQGNKTVIFMTVIIVLVMVILGILWFTVFNVSKYDKGMEFLSRRNYDQALIQFNNIPEGTSEYNSAQSKINYINGVRLFNVNDYKNAKEYLTKVSPTDEYYNEVKLMLDKIQDVEKAEQLKEQLEQDEKNKILEAQKMEEQKVKDKATSKEYFLTLQRLEDKFEGEFELAKVENSVTMKKNLRNLNDIRQQLLDSKYEAVIQDPELLEYRSMVDTWMARCISFITEVISENVLSIQDAGIKAKNILSDADKYKEEVNTKNQKLKTVY